MADAIRFLGREEAEACCNAAPADAPLRPEGTPDRPLSVCRVAFEYELPRLPPVAEDPEHQSLLGQLYLDGPSPTMPRHVAGAQSPAAGWSQLPWTRATCVQPGSLKSVIYRYSPWRWSYAAILRA